MLWLSHVRCYTSCDSEKLQGRSLMRLGEHRIKAAMLAEDPEIRHTALCWFSEGFSADQSVMQIVLDAARNYGPAATWRLLFEAQWLAQSEETFEALLSELGRKYHPGCVGQDNYRFSTGLAVCRAPVEWIAAQIPRIARLCSFPE